MKEPKVDQGKYKKPKIDFYKFCNDMVKKDGDKFSDLKWSDKQKAYVSHVKELEDE